MARDVIAPMMKAPKVPTGGSTTNVGLGLSQKEGQMASGMADTSALVNTYLDQRKAAKTRGYY